MFRFGVMAQRGVCWECLARVDRLVWYESSATAFDSVVDLVCVACARKIFAEVEQLSILELHLKEAGFGCSE